MVRYLKICMFKILKICLFKILCIENLHNFSKSMQISYLMRRSARIKHISSTQSILSNLWQDEGLLDVLYLLISDFWEERGIEQVNNSHSTIREPTTPVTEDAHRYHILWQYFQLNCQCQTSGPRPLADVRGRN